MPMPAAPVWGLWAFERFLGKSGAQAMAGHLCGKAAKKAGQMSWVGRVSGNHQVGATSVSLLNGLWRSSAALPLLVVGPRAQQRSNGTYQHPIPGENLPYSSPSISL